MGAKGPEDDDKGSGGGAPAEAGGQPPSSGAAPPAAAAPEQAAEQPTERQAPGRLRPPAINGDEPEPPPEFIDPISEEIMRDPVSVSAVPY